ncbi:MAG: helix-turn-helix domain-containing protein [Solirubrobacterales bacterium]|nr:helix-turn-helix domain-containing protein [Solirubrobacterales bacterium]
MPDEIGARLREARLHAKIDINEVEVHTKIRAKYLRAIENEQWDLLPGAVYVKSFLRTYGDYLGLDSRQLVDDFRRRYERPSDQELRPIAPPGRDRDRPPRRLRIPPWLVIGAILAIIVVVLILVGRQKTGPSTSTRTQAAKPIHPHRRRRPPVKRAPPRTVKLALRATAQVYVCVVNAAGKQLIPGRIFDVGEPIPTQTASELLVTFGNDGIRMRVNGAVVPVPVTGSPIGYRLSPTRRQLLPPSQQPRCT